ncbi:MAG: hypothetical protein ACREQA_05045 [Candidatus Binatia bacterium]
MKSIKLIFSTLILAGTLPLSTAHLWGAEAIKGIISKVANPGSNYCHLKFPAIHEQTLWGRPVLKDPTDGDIIDFYGPCDHDPLGQEEVRRQRAALIERLRPSGD